MRPLVQVVRPVQAAMVRAGRVRLVLILACQEFLAIPVHLLRQVLCLVRPLVLVLCRVVNST